MKSDVCKKELSLSCAGPHAGGHQQVEAALRKLHPCAVLTLEQLSGSFPSEVTFEPADSLRLHATMQAVVATLSQVSCMPTRMR